MATFEATKDSIKLTCDCGRSHTIIEKNNAYEIETKEPDTPPEEEGLWQRITKPRGKKE
jgi:hypothetical protein